MKRAMIFLLSLMALPCWAAPQDVQVLQTGQGYARLKVTGTAYQSFFESEVSNNVRRLQAAGTAVNTPGRRASATTPPQLTSEIVEITTLRGALSTNIPDWARQEVLESAGFTSWNQVTEAQLDKPISKTVFDMDALSTVSEINYDQIARIQSSSGTAQAAGSTYPQASLAKPLGICSKRHEPKMEEKVYPLSSNLFDPMQSSTGGLTTSLSTKLNGTGIAAARVHYIAKSRCSIPYGAEFRKAEFILNSTLGGELQLDAKAAYKYQQRLFSKSYTYPLYNTDFWVYFLYFQFRSDLKFEIGVDFAFDAAAEMQTTYSYGGKAEITWECTSTSNCVKTKNIVDLKPTAKTQTNYQAQAKVVITPFVDSSIGAELKLYYIDLISARLGILSEFPVTGYAYIGNMCSDGDGDGIAETVRAGYLDLSAQFSGYIQAELLGKGSRYQLDLNLSALGYTYSKQNSGDLAGQTQKVLYTKSLYFKDLISGGSTVFQPIVTVPPVGRTASIISVANRSCYPLKANAIYEVDWGDGTPLTRMLGNQLSHVFPAFGDYTVRVRLASDSEGRSFSPQWVIRTINISADGVTPYRPWLPSLITQILD